MPVRSEWDRLARPGPLATARHCCRRTPGNGAASAIRIRRALKDRTIYYWDGDEFAPVSRFAGSLIKLVPTEWGAPTFEIDGIKMLPTAKVSPFEDARRKVALIEPRGKVVLDTCGGLGYFAACCLEAGAARIHSFEKNADVLWLRTLNPWSPDPGRAQPAAAACSSSTPMCRRRSRRSPTPRWTRCCTTRRASASPASCTRRRSTTNWRACCAAADGCSTTPAAPNKLTSGRDVPREVAKRLENAGFRPRLALDGVLATRR